MAEALDLISRTMAETPQMAVAPTDSQLIAPTARFPIPTIGRQESILSMTISEYLTASLCQETGSPTLTPRPKTSSSSLPLVAAPAPAPTIPTLPTLPPILIVKYIEYDKVQKKIAMLRSKAESWDGSEVLPNLIHLLGIATTGYTLEASFTVPTSEARAPIDLESWRDMLPYINTLWVIFDRNP
ncbi:hypothetical protein FIBSPDRAFT_861779 [Athelia psychrophila]|uniref:Uncharacterized protein n=1 Tax=Athelia psychrophila TaxID=1759441 RepID=A0A166IX14_9AGAM|nr:hypothetical protein FIBSPDRAFT_861779 [Fibularhizoctonia sp. CBS 109695]